MLPENPFLQTCGLLVQTFVVPFCLLRRMADAAAGNVYKADVNANKEKFELTPATSEEQGHFKCVHPRVLVLSAVQSQFLAGGPRATNSRGEMKLS